MDSYKLAFDYALQTDRNLFITGKAGTGKTTFLHRLKEVSSKQMAVVAPTGVAAINAGGTTIHSFFQLPLSPFIPTPEGRKNLIAKTKMRSHRRRVLQELELLVIDEVSMVRADLLDAIDTSLRHFRYRNDELFGGVQVILIGDMFQLAPVVKEQEWQLLSDYYQGPYFFHSHAIIQDTPVYIEFEKIYRQTNSSFINLLNEIRNGTLSEDGYRMLQERYDPLFSVKDDDSYIVLTTHNYKADQINNTALNKLTGDIYTFEANVGGDYPERNYPAEPVLELKKGAKVMFLRNDNEAERRYYNGKTGVIENIEGEYITVLCDDGKLVGVERATWDNISYSIDAKTKQIEENVLGSFLQFPLRLAWAITIHKSQGLTFDKVVIDAEEAFAPGQVYVALSRCKSLEGVVLNSRIGRNSLYTDRQIVDHEKNRPTTDVINNQLEDARKQYRLGLLKLVVDFTVVLSRSQRLLDYVGDNSGSFNDETKPHLEEICKELKNIGDIGGKFKSQLHSIFSHKPIDENYLRERLVAADNFFAEKIDLLINHLRESPATTDNRTHANRYNEDVKDVFSDLSLKKHMLNSLSKDSSIEAYFEGRNNFVLPMFHLSSYAKSSSDRSDLSFPGLYRLLAEERNRICEPRNLPVYIVASSKSLYEMAEYLPQNEKELLQITGFGAVKVERYGHAFLSIIRSYCEENGLESRLPKEKGTKRKKKEKNEKSKKQKGDSQRITLEMYQSGNTIEEIAEERKLAVSTISVHLAKYVKSGEIDVSDFVTKERLLLAEEKLRSRSPDESIYHTLYPEFSNIEIMMFIAHHSNT